MKHKNPADQMSAGFLRIQQGSLLIISNAGNPLIHIQSFNALEVRLQNILVVEPEDVLCSFFSSIYKSEEV